MKSIKFEGCSCNLFNNPLVDLVIPNWFPKSKVEKSVLWVKIYDVFFSCLKNEI